ncbi:MAG: Ppx/GppA family phosphatase, partial [Pseudomonadota bacterium]
MADTLPPDKKRSAGKNGSGKSGSVADFRYKRSFQQGGKGQRRPKGGPSGQSRTAQRPALADEKDCAQVSNTTYAPNSMQQRPSGDGRAPFRREAYAALDLGTNNCRLLIARPSGKDFTVIDAFSRVVRLGEDLATTGRLSDEAMDRTLSALSICADKLKRRNVRLARSVATEACRRAENGADFIERVRRETGIALDIISAEEEARLAVLGCHILLEQGTGPAIIFDIGGGSTELVLLESDGQSSGKIPRIIDWQSVPWGVVSLTDTVSPTPGKKETREARLERYARMREVVSTSFEPFAERIASAAEATDIRLLGTSGTVTTLASLHL